MIQVDSNNSIMGFLLSPRHCGLSSLHHSDSSMAFNLSDSSLDWPEYDEATEPTETVKSPSSPVARVAQEEMGDAPETDDHRHRHRQHQPVLDFSQSWPGARRSSEVVEPTDLTTKSKKQKQNNQRRSSMSHNSSNNKPKTTKVRFSPTLEVRTHNIVLGDHPWCEDGLALELGWDYVDSRDICHNKEPRLPRWRSPQMQTRKHKPKRSSSPPRQLSYLERKKLLLEVGGCSKVEIELRRFQSQILLQIEQDRQARLVEEQRRRRQQRSSSAAGSSSRSPSPSDRRSHRSSPSIPTSRAGSPSLYAAMA